MDNVHFSKLTKDCSLLGGALNTTEADIIFSKVGGWIQMAVDFNARQSKKQ